MIITINYQNPKQYISNDKNVRHNTKQYNNYYKDSIAKESEIYKAIENTDSKNLTPLVGMYHVLFNGKHLLALICLTKPL